MLIIEIDKKSFYVSLLNHSTLIQEGYTDGKNTIDHQAGWGQKECNR